jgi:hypothetical protein
VLKILFSFDALVAFCLSVALAFPITGFIAGVVLCTGCSGLWGNTIGRAFIGLVMAALNTASLGRPPKNEAAIGDTYSFISQTLAASVIIFSIWLLLKFKEG